MLNKKRLSVLDANLLYLIGAILFWTIGAHYQSKSLQSGLIITQYVVILLPPIIYIMAKRLNIKQALRLNKISFKHGFLVGCITILAYPSAVFANALIMTIMSFVGNLNIPQLPTATTSSEYIVLMLIISISAGICEEVFFRGFVLSGYERMGNKKAIVLSAVLFGFFHFNLYNLVGPIVLGLVFGYLVQITDSIFAGMIGHIVNNGFAVTLGFIINSLPKVLPDMDAANEMALEIPTSIAMLTTTIFFGIISMVTLLIAYQLVKIIKKDREGFRKEEYVENTNIKVKVKSFEFAPLIFTGILFVIVAIAQIKEIMSLG